MVGRDHHMKLLSQFGGALLGLAIASVWMPIPAFAQEAPRYITPAQSVQKRGSAPGMKVKVISSGQGQKEYAIIFSEGDEAYSGLLDFAEKYHVTSGHFTAIGALSSVVLAWFDPQKKMYRENPIHEQVEVASMIGDFALYQGKPALHTHMVVGHHDGTASGGHVIEAIVAPTLEVFVTIDPVPLQKKYDPASDLTLIDPDSK
jgi:predicted DNA-binding protein with PD1-like motif